MSVHSDTDRVSAAPTGGQQARVIQQCRTGPHHNSHIFRPHTVYYLFGERSGDDQRIAIFPT